LAEHIDIIDRRKGDGKLAVRDNDALQFDRKKTGAPCLDADFADDGIH
jgi:hypothetical protein